MIRIALVVTYLIGMVLAVVSMDAHEGAPLVLIWLVASVLLGAATGEFRFALLSFLAVPIAIPFGHPADMEGDPVFPVWVEALYFAMYSSVVILLSALTRRIVESRRRRRRAPRDSGIA